MARITYLLQSSRFAQIFKLPFGESSFVNLGRNWMGEGPKRKFCLGMLRSFAMYAGSVADILGEMISRVCFLIQIDWFRGAKKCVYSTMLSEARCMYG